MAEPDLRWGCQGEPADGWTAAAVRPVPAAAAHRAALVGPPGTVRARPDPPFILLQEHLDDARALWSHNKGKLENGWGDLEVEEILETLGAGGDSLQQRMVH